MSFKITIDTSALTRVLKQLEMITAKAIPEAVDATLKCAAEEAGFFGGRRKMDSREWYEVCYFAPLEDFLFRSLMAKYAYDENMHIEDVAVCVSTWT